MKLLILGNSLTYHTPAPQIGWHGDWGMAASALENDFVHRLCSKLEDAGKTVQLRFRNIADFERDPSGIAQSYFSEDIAFEPDIVVLRISENTPMDKQQELADAYEALIQNFRADSCCTVIAVGPFWQNDTIETLLREAANRSGAIWLSLSCLHGDISCQAVGQFEHSGVAAHPSDKGMNSIADIIFNGIKDAGLLSGAQIIPMPVDEPVFDQYNVCVDGIPVPLYQLHVSKEPFNRFWPGHERPIEQSELAAMLTFDMIAPVDITLTWFEDIHDAIIRPQSKGVSIVYKGNKASFTVRSPGQYSVEINGRHHNLHLFANTPEDHVPNPNDVTYYFAPGTHEVGNLRLHSGDTVYLAAGSIVHGGIQAYDERNIHIFGRGILDYSKTERNEPLIWEQDGIVNLVRCENVIIDGIILRDAAWWTITSFNCINLLFRNCKSVGMWRYNADGFDFVNCQNIHVENCFLRNFDDVIVFKGLRVRNTVLASDPDHKGEMTPYEHMNIYHLLVENCVLWCDWGSALEIGAETVADEYSGIIYRNCDIIRAAHCAMRIQSGDRAHIHNVLYENIRVEYSKYDRAPVLQETDDDIYLPPDTPWVCDLIQSWMYCNVFSDDGILGEVSDITYRDIAIYADDGLSCPSIAFHGGDAQHRIHNISIEGITFNGMPVTPTLDLNEYTDNIILSKEAQQEK